MIPRNPNELEAAFRRAMKNTPPSDSQVISILRNGGWTPETASRQLSIHPCFIQRILNAIEHLPENPTPA